MGAGPKKALKFPLTIYNTQYSHFVAIIRSVKRIQRFFKFKKVKARIAALSALCKYIQNLNSRILYLDENVYLQIEQLAQENELYNNFVEADLLKVSVSHKTNQIEMEIESPRYSEFNMPLWFNLRTDTSIPLKSKHSSAISRVPRRLKRDMPNVKNDVLSLLHATGSMAIGI
jgi:hypothetical protein